MAEEIQRLICLDTTVLIDYFRKSKKENSFIFKLIEAEFQGFLVPIVFHFEIYKGANEIQVNYWNNLFADFLIIPYSQIINNESIKIHKQLKLIRKSIEFKDLIIAATAKSNNHPLATINKKHFDNIEGLNLITPDDL